ncbi:hypothetical protein [Alteromonas sp. a30]|uniref:hypothetical protein n=1 Tax=Alteromonas sp. a30 TaxID=2730917 RepID=UPI002280C3F8|nr:hypothetical protein [Alteromonas sp. a30]MCY7297526.1 hypothetical protein [Alteromonas sp. a30]
MNEDFFENGKPVHRLSYCAFLDLLGFSARTKESYKNQTGNQLLQEFHEIFSNQIAKMKEETEESLLYFKSFSDNVLLAHPRFSDDMESEFGFILWAIQEYQFAMALKGFFIRGGLSVGQLFVDDDNVYGEALIDAYQLESKAAINPMVVLCDNTMKLVDHHLTYYQGEWAPQLNDVLVNSDGRYFINYLSECVVDTGEGYELDIESLAIHRDRIIEALSEYSDKPPVFSKFIWLSNYHNYFCDSVSSFQNYSDDLKVSDSLSKVEFKKLNEK